MTLVADWMKRAIGARNDEKSLDVLKKEVVEFTKDFPLPSDKK
jgi:glycine/serine hydroxymethyltransferase